MFPDLTKPLTAAFSWTLYRRSIKLCVTITWGLQIYTVFDDCGLVSRSHMCQKHQLQVVVFRFLSTINSVWGLVMLLARERERERERDIKDYAQCALCVSAVYLGDN